MSIKSVCFSSQGRLNRGAFWKVGLCWALAMVVLGIVMTVAANADQGSSAVAIVCSLVGLLFGIAMIWSGICLGIKRYHDLGKSGAWVLIQFVPIVGPLWYLIEAGFIRGNAGSNRFGADPLAVQGASALSLGTA